MAERDPDFFKLHYRQWKQRMHKLRVDYKLQGALLCIVIETHLTGAPPADDDFVLAGILMVSPRKARAIVDQLLALGLVRVEGSMIVDKTAVEDSDERRDIRAIRAQSGREGGVRSGKVRRARADLKVVSGDFASSKPLNDNETGKAKPTMTFELEKSREEKKVKRTTIVVPKKPTRIPTDWHVSQKLMAWTFEQGLTEQEACLEADQFRDHWRAATKNATSPAWDAKWRTWVRNHVKWKPTQRRTKTDDRLERIMRMADGADRRAEIVSEENRSNGAGVSGTTRLLPEGDCPGDRGRGDDGVDTGAVTHPGGSVTDGV